MAKTSDPKDPTGDVTHVIGHVKAIGEEGADYDVEFTCSTDVVDRSDEVIEQDGWELDNFRKNPVFLAAHMHRLSDGRSPVIGSFVEIGVKDGALTGTVRFADTELGREYKTLYRDRHMRAVSVGFMPLQGETRSGEGGRKRYHHTSQELYEVSAVAVGCNQEALARMAALETDAVAEAVGKCLAEFAAALDARLADIEEMIADLAPDSVNERTGPATPKNAPAGRRSDVADGGGGARAGDVTRAAAGLIAACAEN